MRNNEPVYLIVHKDDFQYYADTLADTMDNYPNLQLIGWDGGAMTGFGAARCAALAFADTLAYHPTRIIMMDQDVMQTEGTRHTRPDLIREVEKFHQETGLPVLGYGVGYPTRVEMPKPFTEIPAPIDDDFNSPTQQFVSVSAPFRNRMADGIYPAYMVAGGEDMLMGLKQNLYEKSEKKAKNRTLLNSKIVKKELKGEADTPNTYWNQTHVNTLKTLYEAEKNTLINFENKQMTLDQLMSLFMERGWISAHPSPESYNVMACIIERMILRLKKEGKFPKDEDSTIFNSVSASK
ncbi:MAG: hypothetical protein ACRC5A_07885 [Enterobacteriaceae bacterium]